MQVVGSKLCKRAESGCNLSKRQRRKGGPAPAHEALAKIATPLSSFAQFAASHLHLPIFCGTGCSFVCICTGRHPLGNSFHHLGTVSSPNCTMVYYGAPWYTMIYNGILWYTIVYRLIPWHTVVYPIPHQCHTCPLEPGGRLRENLGAEPPAFGGSGGRALQQRTLHLTRWRNRHHA